MAAKFKTISKEGVEVERAQSRQAHTDRMVEEGSGDELLPAAPGRALSTVLDSVGDSRTPFTAQAFRERVRKKLGLSVEDPFPGFTRYASDFRAKQLEDMFVKDTGQIPKDEQFSYDEPCTLAHPGWGPTSRLLSHSLSDLLIAGYLSLAQ